MSDLVVNGQAVCGYTGDDYAQVIADLFPRGFVWPRDPESVQQLFIRGLAEEFARLNVRNCDLLDESYPCGASEAIPDWERVLGLPDPCTGPLPTLQQRRQAICAKLAFTGGSSEQYFIDLAAAYGYDITITTFAPFRVETNTVEQALYDEEWVYAWQVNIVSNQAITYFRVDESTVEEPLAWWGDEVLECVLNNAKPAHTVLIFAYQAESIWDGGATVWDGGTTRWDYQGEE